ncbi:uncharacterized protein MYCFIDRAFT_172366 [Pseudocercospora fijiensis CIRAD86]|uniref:Uncharacterized protein n=1 Tax=Pseudocercospora fijiensis (strain CIRAD86) TaxID=383855 RepID=M3A6C8_PSEFD|nr:uncharacterized protein MYCFIDRAFT_172366 [Pseudocercospora fijiensis CIRAD86]EME86659.1 hypothetical protein MYCFIDRAFT_172366 [Pseudocercospora fijiensis CIRAD86]
MAIAMAMVQGPRGGVYWKANEAGWQKEARRSENGAVNGSGLERGDIVGVWRRVADGSGSGVWTLEVDWVVGTASCSCDKECKASQGQATPRQALRTHLPSMYLGRSTE